MPIVEMLWTIQEERRRTVALAARERLVGRRQANASLVERLAGWVRGRIRARRDGSTPTLGWTASR